MRRLAFVVLVGCSSKSSPPKANAGDAAVAAAAHDAAVAPKVLDAAAVAATLDAGSDAAAAVATSDASVKPAAPPSGPGPSGAWFGVAVPLGGKFVSMTPVRVEVDGPGAADLDEDTWDGVVARKLDPASAEAAALHGRKLTVYDAEGATCAATIEDVLAVRTAQVPFDLRKASRDGKGGDALADALWKEAKNGYLGITTSGCDGVLALPADAPTLVITKLKAASDEVDAAVQAAFEGGHGQDLDAKKELEDLDGTPWKYTSTRVLTPKTGAAIAVAYVKIFGERTIALFPVPPVGTNWPLAEIAADSPSTVIGLDVDGDGELDALVDHPAGTALYLSGPEQLWGGKASVFVAP